MYESPFFSSQYACSANRGIRHMFGIKVRGQRTKSTGRRGHAAIAGKKKPGLK